MGISWLFLNTAFWSEKKYLSPTTNKQTNRVKDQILGLFGLLKKCIRIIRICQNIALHFRSWSPSAGNRQCLSWHGQSRRRQSLQKGATRNPNKSSRPCRPCRPCRTDTNVASALKIFWEFCIFTADFFSLSLSQVGSVQWANYGNVEGEWKCWMKVKVLDESESGGWKWKWWIREENEIKGSMHGELTISEAITRPCQKQSQKCKKNLPPSAENFTKIYQFLKIDICSK